jgi:hypothetical protein
MNEIVRLRDHTKMCEHGSLIPHWTTDGTGRWWRAPECYGGREVVLERVESGLWREVEVEPRV